MSRLQVLIVLLLASWTSLATLSARADAVDRFTTPGKYRVVGTVLIRSGELVLQVFGESAGETDLRIEFPTEPGHRREVVLELGSLINHPATLVGTISVPPRDQHGMIRVREVSPAEEDPLDPAHGNGFWRLR